MKQIQRIFQLILKLAFFNLGILVILGICISSLPSLHAYTSDNSIIVSRLMPEFAHPGESIPVKISIYVAHTIVGPIRGFYFVDNIPADLSFSPNSYAVRQNGHDLNNIIIETGSANEIYPLSTPSRVILEIPPLFSRDNFLSGGDVITIEYSLRIPSGAVSRTQHTFPGYNWAAQIQHNSGEAIFGYEDLPAVAIQVVDGGTTTTTGLFPPDTTTTTTGLFPPDTSTTTTGLFPPDTTTSTVPGSSATTTTSYLSSCVINIHPAIAELTSRQIIRFAVESDGECDEPHYEWSVESMLGSTCDQDGNYTAGTNSNFLNPKTDAVTVFDYGNGGISSRATVTVYSSCAILNIYGHNLEKIKLFRKYRDTVLNQSPEGRAMISLYYAWSPTLIKIMDEDEAFREDLKSLIDAFLQLISQTSN